jgi:peptidase E
MTSIKGFIFAVGNFSWYTLPEFVNAFHLAVHSRQLLIYVPTALVSLGVSAAQFFGFAEERRRSLAYKKVVVLDFQSYDLEAANHILQVAGPEACIYLEGGNTFTLRHFARPFDEMCARAIQHQGVSCVGVSAGALLCGSTVQPALWKGLDNPCAPPIPKVDWLDSATSAGWNLLDGLTFFHALRGEMERACGS